MDTLPVVAGFETLILETAITPQGARKTTLDAACSRLAAIVAEAALGADQTPDWADPELRTRLLPDASASADPKNEAKMIALEFMLGLLTAQKLRTLLSRARPEKCKSGMTKRALLDEIMEIACEEFLVAPAIEVSRAVASETLVWTDFSASAAVDAPRLPKAADALPLPKLEEPAEQMEVTERRPKRMRASAAEAMLKMSSCRRPQHRASKIAAAAAEPEADEMPLPPAKTTRGKPAEEQEEGNVLDPIRGLNADDIESRFKMAELKDLLRAAGLPVTGRRKADLVERLMEHV